MQDSHSVTTVSPAEDRRALEALLDPHAVAGLLGVSESLLYKMVASKRIPVTRIGGVLRFRPSDIAQYIAASTVPAGE